jgi:DHA1 family bicyclomycin/chloramphenicol resistance-like MFS transporter
MSSLHRRAIVLGLLIAVGAFAIDMYIPGFAAIAADLHTDPGTVQLSMTSFFVALALGQVIYGPVSDAVGRRAPILAGLGLFMLASAAAAFAPTIGLLIAARFVQGLGAAATAVVPMAVIRDEYTGPDAAKVLSLAMLSLSVSPILAPVFGGLLVQYTSWRVIFGVLIVICAAVGAMVLRLLPETHPRARRVSARPLSILLTYRGLVRDRRFIVPIMIASCGQAVLFVFISGSPFVFVTLHRVPPTTYGLLFALHAIAIIGISQFNAPMLRAFGARRLIGGASILLTAAAVGLAALVAGGMTALWPFHVARADPGARVPDRDGAVRRGRRRGGGGRRGARVHMQFRHHHADGPDGGRHGAADDRLPGAGRLRHPRGLAAVRPHAREGAGERGMSKAIPSSRCRKEGDITSAAGARMPVAPATAGAARTFDDAAGQRGRH